MVERFLKVYIKEEKKDGEAPRPQVELGWVYTKSVQRVSSCKIIKNTFYNFSGK